MSITITTTLDAAYELGAGGNTPSVKFALWIAALSTQQTLEKNGRLARLLAPYVHGILPNRETLYNLLKTARAVLYTSHLDSLYYSEYLERTGQLAGLEHIGTTYAEQVEWRDRVYKLCKGHGLSWKTISFAALILAPLSCELVPIDRHVMMRLGKGTHASPQVRSTYLRIEQEVMEERDDAGFSTIPLGIWHWYKWEEYRSLVAGSSKGNGDVESHADLSCRLY